MNLDSDESKKFRLILDFDGILKQGNNMTINQLADIMNKRFDKIESRLDEHDAIFERNNLK